MYFSIFPTIIYKDGLGQRIRAINITKRYRFVEKVLRNKYILYNYTIKDGERADMIAEKYYGAADEDFLIWLMNIVIDPFFEWPMSSREFGEFIKKKYGSIPVAHQTTAKWFKIIQPKAMTFDGISIPEKVVEVDEEMYNTIVDLDRKKISVFEMESDLNEERRIIKLIDKAYIPQIREELLELYDG